MLEDSDELRDAIDKAFEKGIVIVAASGNDLHGDILYPAKYENVISVSSIDQENRILFSSYDGKSIYVPGGDIVSTYSSIYVSQQYASMTGTSLSAPIVTGTIALIMEQNPGITNTEILDYFNEFDEKSTFNIKEILVDFYNL